MRSLACYLKEYKGKYSCTVFQVSEVVFDLIVPLVIAQIIDVEWLRTTTVTLSEDFILIAHGGGSRSYLQLHRPVRSESQRRLRRKSPSGRFRPHPAPLIYRAGYPQNRHLINPSD